MKNSFKPEAADSAHADGFSIPHACPGRCSLTITAITGDLKPLAAAIAEYDAISPDLAESRLKALPNLLESVILWDRAETFAGKLESMGASVDLRPGWRT